jgi:hypothetical protein
MVQDNVKAYRLKKQELEKWLRKTFPASQYGQLNFKVEVSNKPNVARAGNGS